MLHGKFTLITDQKHLVKTPEARRDGAASSWQVPGVDSRGGTPFATASGGLETRSAQILSATAGWQCSPVTSHSLHFPLQEGVIQQKKLQRVKLTDFLIFFFWGEICAGGMESGWRTVSPRGKHFWCLVSNLLEKNHCQCQLQSVSMQKLASVPVPARDRKLRPRGVHRGLNMEFWISPS